MTREHHSWDSFTPWCHFSCCSGDSSGWWTVLPLCLLCPAHQGEILSCKAPQNVTQSRTSPPFLVPVNLMTVPRAMLHVCQTEEVQRQLNCSFRSYFGHFPFDLYSVAWSLWKWHSEKMRARVRNCWKLSRIPVANVVAIVYEMRIIDCIGLSQCSKLSPGVTKVKYDR